MEQFQFRDYTIRISNRLYTIYGDTREKIMVIFPNTYTICATLHFSEKGNLVIDCFWGVTFDLKDKDVFMYYNDEIDGVTE